MSNAPAPVFFVPFADEPHEAWNELRNIGESWLGRPLRDRKVFALSFVHDGVDYYARVGEPRHATKHHKVRGKIDYNRPPRRYDDGAPVLAIFQAEEDGGPFLIFDAGSGIDWNNPALVGSSAVRDSGRDFAAS
jgi:hypothetical protein